MADAVKTSKRGFLKKFKISGNAGFIIEFGDKYIRLFVNHGQLLEESAAYELTSPYTLSDLWNEELECCNLQTVQNGDILYLFHPKYMKRLVRYANDNWALEDWELLNGPWNHVNTTETTITASGTTGTINLTASANLFAEDDVGRLIRLTLVNDDTTAWQTEKEVAQNAIWTSDGKYYQALNAGTTGNVKPVHTEGSKSDGAVTWKYLHAGYGTAKITEYVSQTGVKASVITELPKELVTSHFEFGMIYPGKNYPMSGTFYKNRFWILIDADDGLKACGSYSGDFNNFADQDFGEVTDECAVTVPVNSKEYNQGRWIAAADVLFVGTSSGEFYIDAVSNGSALAADNVAIRQISSIGSKPIEPVAIGGHVLFVDRFGTSIRDLVYSYDRDGYDPLDASILGRHLLVSGIVAWDWQDCPDKILWLAMADGRLVSFTFDAQQQVAALAWHDLSGAVESIAVIPSNDERRDDVWLAVKRTIGNVCKRYVEWIDSGTKEEYGADVESISDPDKREAAEIEFVRDNSFFVDSGLVYNRPTGDTATKLTGFEHLKGMEVAVSANGMERPHQIVADDGSITIKETDVRVVVGLPMKSVMVPQKIYLPTDSGYGLSAVQRIDHLTLMVYRSYGGKAGASYDKMQEILYRTSSELAGHDVELFTGNVVIPWPAGSSLVKNKGANIIIENESVYPMHILALVPSMASSGG